MTFEEQVADLKNKISVLKKERSGLEGTNVGPQASIEAKVATQDRILEIDKEIEGYEKESKELKDRESRGCVSLGGQGLIMNGVEAFATIKNKGEVEIKSSPKAGKTITEGVRCGCGQILSMNQKFCNKCGKLYTGKEMKEIAEKDIKRCPRCNYPNDKKSGWCSMCGAQMF